MVCVYVIEKKKFFSRNAESLNINESFTRALNKQRRQLLELFEIEDCCLLEIGDNRNIFALTAYFHFTEL